MARPRPSVSEHTNQIKMFVAAALGALFLAIGDLLNNEHAATTLKIGELIKQHIYSGIANTGLVALIVIILLGCAVCWINEPATRMDAFGRGFSVFAILTVITPYSPVETEIASADTNNTEHAFNLSLFSAAHAQPTNDTDQKQAITLQIVTTSSKQVRSTVTVRKAKTAHIMQRITTQKNEVILRLPPGTYDIVVEAAGYQRTAMTITSGENGRSHQIKLQPSRIPLGIQRLFSPAQIKPVN